MQKNVILQVEPREAEDAASLKNALAQSLSIPPSALTGYQILKSSLDARGKNILRRLELRTFINEPPLHRTLLPVHYKDVRNASRKVIIIGAGPAGLFAALQLLEAGIQPVLFERGKEVQARRRDLAILNKKGIVDPDSNYCFGEGGAGTYSDGKLYTRSTKRGSVQKILELFYRFGAPESILYESHPHIGTNKLPQIISALRHQLLDAGAAIHFESRVSRILVKNDQVEGVALASGDIIHADAVILATGHSARDIFQSLAQDQIEIESKPFALGVRVEHPQSLIDRIQYHCDLRGPYLPAAAYSLVQQVNGRGVFSFCMCPGGIIAAAATAPGELVVNGWSPSKRNNPFANSGIVASVGPSDYLNEKSGNDPLAAMHFQQAVEQKAFAMGGGHLTAPAQRLTDFIQKRTSTTLPACSYVPGVRSVALHNVLPPFIFSSLAEAFKAFGKKMKGYLTEEAIAVATESRTSSPVKVPRDKETLEHIRVKGLYPCGEGAGYAGGIVSAAMDGERVARAIALKWKLSF